MKTLLLALLAAFTLTLRAQPQQDGPLAERAAVLEDKRIHESSGLTRSLRHPELFWTHNDSASDPCIYAIDRQGKTRAKVRLPEAVNFDWEDMASALNADGEPQLYIADIGDNLHARAGVQLYRIPEPDLLPTAEKEMLSVKPTFWQLRYPDGKHNAETLLVHPRTRRVVIVTKTEDGKCAAYAMPENAGTEKPVVMEKIATLDLPVRHRLGKRPHDACMTTGGAFSSDGSRIVIASYSYLYEWRLSRGDTLESALKKAPEVITPPLLPQLEAVCYDADGRSLWLTSERLPTVLWRLVRS